MGKQCKQCQTLFIYLFFGSDITADGDCSHEIKRCLLLGRKVMTSLDSILKSRDITLPTNVRLVKAMVFPVIVYGCESWIVNKAECQRIDAFKLWCWRRLESPLDCKEIQPVHPKGHQSWGVHWKDRCWSWNSNTLATWWVEMTHWKRPWFWEGLGARGEGEDRGWDGWMASPTWWTWTWVNSGSLWWTGRPGVLRFMVLQKVGYNWMTELSWTDEDLPDLLELTPKKDVLLIIMDWNAKPGNQETSGVTGKLGLGSRMKQGKA